PPGNGPEVFAFRPCFPSSQRPEIIPKKCGNGAGCARSGQFSSGYNSWKRPTSRTRFSHLGVKRRSAMVRAPVWYLGAAVAALGLLAWTAVPAQAQHGHGGGHGGGAHGVAVHGGAIHSGAVHGSSFHSGGFHHSGHSHTAVVIGLGFGGYPGYYRNYGYG